MTEWLWIFQERVYVSTLYIWTHNIGTQWGTLGLLSTKRTDVSVQKYQSSEIQVYTFSFFIRSEIRQAHRQQRCGNARQFQW